MNLVSIQFTADELCNIYDVRDKFCFHHRLNYPERVCLQQKDAVGTDRVSLVEGKRPTPKGWPQSGPSHGIPAAGLKGASLVNSVSLYMSILKRN